MPKIFISNRRKNHLNRLVRDLDHFFVRKPQHQANTPIKQPINQPGDVFKDKLKDGSEGPAMVVIPPGTFAMGSPQSEERRRDDEGPQHNVTITKPFALGQYSVTFADYDCFAKATERELPDFEGWWGRDKRPVTHVSWDDAQDYATWLSGQTGVVYRLPSEAEWEYAARAGTTTPFYCGETINTDLANYDGDCIYGPGRKGKYIGKTVKVGRYSANPFKLYDMHGNVWEWVQDCYTETYDGAPTDGLACETGDCFLRVLRGGSWDNEPLNVRSSIRYRGVPVNRDFDVGFRLARTL